MSEATTAEDGIRTYRGGSIESLLPQIRGELGPDAVVLSRREGLVGGVGGFFQKRCVEVDARAGGPGIDVYDEDEEDEFDEEGTVPEPPLVRSDRATREGLATPAIQELVEQAHPFAEVLGELSEESRPVVEAPPKARALVEGMVGAGLGEDLAREVVESVLANVMPFATPGRLRTLVRDQLALRIPVARAAAPGARTLVFVGPAGAGKTAAMTTIGAAYEGSGTADGLALVDAPELDEVAVPKGAEVHLVLRAGIAAATAAEAIAGQRPLAPTHLLLTGAGETRHLGGVVDAAIRSGIPLGYVAESAGEIVPADPRELAGRIVP